MILALRITPIAAMGSAGTVLATKTRQDVLASQLEDRRGGVRGIHEYRRLTVMDREPPICVFIISKWCVRDDPHVSRLALLLNESLMALG